MKTLITAVFIALAASLVNAQDTPVYPEGKKIEGTWNMLLTLRDCETGSPLPVQLRGLNSFAGGGVMMEVPSGLAPSTRYPGLGVWKHVDGRNYVGTFKAFRYSSNVLAGKSIFVANITHELDDTLLPAPFSQTMTPTGIHRRPYA